METHGWVCVITNKPIDGLVKIGFSSKYPKLRAAELSSSSGSPYTYIIKFGIMVKQPLEFEQKMHAALKDVHESKEWFRCSLAHAVRTVKMVIGDCAILESQSLGGSPGFEIKAEGKAQTHQFREWGIEREEILNRWRRKDRIRGEIVALLNLYSSGSAKTTKAIKKKYGIEISHHRLSFKNIDEVVSLIDEAFEAKERENKKREDRERKIKEYKKYGG
jgi:hypothetical protein